MRPDEFPRGAWLLVVALIAMITLVVAYAEPTPLAPCRCGAAPATSIIFLPDVVVRS